MHVTVDLAGVPPEVTLVEPDDCARFDVVVRGTGDTDDLGRTLLTTSVGRMEGDEALVSADAVRHLATGSVGDGWEADFTFMLDYAKTKGWLTADGSIRAHVEWH